MDTLRRSAVVLVATLAASAGLAQETLFEDAFDRAAGATVGNGWVETEAAGAAVGISNGALAFLATSDAVRRPLAAHSFPAAGGATLVWEFRFDWTRSGSEKSYAVHMQLGDAARMSGDSPDAGVAVNLVWTRIGTADQQLAYRRAGAVTALRTLSGAASIRVTVDLVQSTYDVTVNGAAAGSRLPFDSAVPLTAVRFFTDALNEAYFTGRTFDQLRITGQQAGGGNATPVARDDLYSVGRDNVLPVAAPGVLANDTDADGDALTAHLVAGASHGSITLGADGSFSYSPAAGFTGTDAFTYTADDGTQRSAAATVSIDVGQQAVLFSDTFSRANSATVGNGWTETEATGAAVAVQNGRLLFVDTSDVANRPVVRRGFAEVAAGSLTWEFELDWTRTGSEAGYAVHMQLGDGAQMSADAPHAGVGVNLVWTRVGTQDQMLGYRRAGSATALRQVSGLRLVRVHADLDRLAYDVYVDGALARAAIPFDVPVALNTVRFFTDVLNEANFAGRSFDSVMISGRSSGGGGNAAPVARNALVRAADGVAKTITLGYTDGDGPGPYTFDVVAAPRHGTLGDDDGDATVVYTASAGFVGNDSLTFRVSDGLAQSNLATISLAV